MVIEDDFLGDLDYLEERPSTLASLAASDFPSVAVTRIRTFSKTLLPSLRIAEVSANAEFVKRLLNAKVSDDLGNSAILQRGLARFISDGLFSSHLERVRPRYRASRESLRRGLSTVGGGLKFGDPPAGLSLLGFLPADIELSRFVTECAHEGVVLTGGNDYWMSPDDGKNTFRIGFGPLSPEEISRATHAISIAVIRSREYSVDHPLI